MSGDAGPPPAPRGETSTGGPSGPAGGAEDPLSADRRTLVIAAVAMVALIAVGVVSAEVFTRSACGAVEPDPVEAGPVDTDVGGVLAGSLEGLAPDEVDRTVDGLAVLGGREPAGGARGAGLAPVAAADVGAADHLLVGGQGVVAAGGRITSLVAPSGDAAARAGAAAEVREPARVVGSGPTLYSVALGNESTGQVDAIAPVPVELVGGGCTDTAKVGVPLAFHLDAGGGQLLLLRLDDEGEDPEVELRDADGPVWTAPLELGAGPPGALAGRLDGLLGTELVVTARRARADERAPALTAHERSSGAERWTVPPDRLDAHAPAGDEALELDAVTLTDELVVVAVSREERDAAQLVALDADDGSWRWTSDVGAVDTPRPAGVLDGAPVVVVPVGAATQRVVRLDPGGAQQTLHAAEGARVRATVVGSTVLVAAERILTVVPPDGPSHSTILPPRVVDVAAVGAGAAVLLRDGRDGAVVWLGR